MDINNEAARRDLLELRKKHGAETPIGRRCSNLVEQIEVLGKTTDADQVAKLTAGIKIQMDELATLVAKGERQ